MIVILTSKFEIAKFYCCYCFREEKDYLSADAIKQALTLHKNKVMTYDMESTQRINVLRSDVFKDGIYAFGRATFDTTKYLKSAF